MDPFLGEIRPVAFDFPPVGWAICNGALLQIATNDALYSLLGTTYGGNGIDNFALPDLVGRVPMHKGTGVGLSERKTGQKIGTENAELTKDNMATHQHTIACSDANATNNSPVGNFPAMAIYSGYYTNPTPTLSSLNNQTVNATGANTQQAMHNNMMPYLAINYIICLNGIYPTQQ